MIAPFCKPIGHFTLYVPKTQDKFDDEPIGDVIHTANGLKNILCEKWKIKDTKVPNVDFSQKDVLVISSLDSSGKFGKLAFIKLGVKTGENPVLKCEYLENTESSSPPIKMINSVLLIEIPKGLNCELNVIKDPLFQHSQPTDLANMELELKRRLETIKKAMALFEEVLPEGINRTACNRACEDLRMSIKCIDPQVQLFKQNFLLERCGPDLRVD